MAEIFVYTFYTYLVIGFLFGLWFAFKGVQKIDTGMNEAKWNLRLLILPGSIALWPIMLRKYLKS
jgi:uncharacterized membrane protein HdeD (DUF308 family)